jgi:hypothetical protein
MIALLRPTEIKKNHLDVDEEVYVLQAVGDFISLRQCMEFGCFSVFP